MSKIVPSQSGIASADSIAEAASGLHPGRRPVDFQEAGSWFEAMAKAWGNALDAQASRIADMSNALNEGGDQPSTVTLITAEAMRMQFLSNSAHTSNNSVGQALETLGRKQ